VFSSRGVGVRELPLPPPPGQLDRTLLEAQAKLAAASQSRSRPLVMVEKLSKLYPLREGFFSNQRLVHAVDGVSLYIRRGETLGLVGESGSGKTTLGRCILRLVEPTLGRVVFDGLDITRMGSRELRALRRRMQIVFQDPQASLNPRMTVAEIVGEGIEIFSLAKTADERREKVTAALARVGLGEALLGRYPHELSGGQRQRIGIARALAVNPDFVVCDEPISALDVSVQATILNLLETLQEDLGLGYLFISHDLRAVAYTSHRIAVMYLGRIVETGPAKDVAERRLHPYTRALFDAKPTFEATGASPDAPPRVRLVLQGEAPSAIAPPPGCVFHPRCPRSEKGKCDTEVPALEELVPGSHHRVACWHPHAEQAVTPLQDLDALDAPDRGSIVVPLATRSKRPAANAPSDAPPDDEPPSQK
jgi:oligopeptide transport system ATP-binding protein